MKSVFAKTITAAGVIVALYLAYHHAWSGMVIAGLVAILAARWSELSRMRRIWRGDRAAREVQS
ncbi:hypothetical protein BSZ23_00340 [Bradyrhizobium canariense]|jgi:hypothetical protein|nr:hypothetical protein BSZ23_00340 [Bradyrhizobium canariense]